MTLENCKRLLAHYEEALKPGFVQGSPPQGLSSVARKNMEAARDNMAAHITMKEAKMGISKSKSAPKPADTKTTQSNSSSSDKEE